MIEYDKFRKSLELLEEQNTRLNGVTAEQPGWVVDAVKESLIQRFEPCWDCLWRVLRRYLTEEIGLPDVPNGPNPMMRLAGENHLLSGAVEQWLSYAKNRIDTSHDYSGEKAEAALAMMDGFVGDAIRLYTTLSGRPWA